MRNLTIKKISLSLILSLTLAFLLLHRPGLIDANIEDGKEWAVLVYMMPSPDLEAYAFWDLYEMEASYIMHRAGSTEELDLVVQIQPPNDYHSYRFHIEQSQNEFDRNLTIEDFAFFDIEDIQSPLVQTIEKSGTQAENLARFLDWAMHQYPAKNYMLVLWGHGSGYKGMHKLTPKQISNILAQTPEAIDVYASDACLMQQLEVAYELAAETRFIVGSSQIQSFMGFPYRRMIYEMNRGCYGLRKNDDPYCGDHLGQEETAPLPEKMQRHCGDDKACALAHMLPPLMRQSFSHPERSLQYPGDPKAIEKLSVSSLLSSPLKHGLSQHLHATGESLLHVLKELNWREREDMQYFVKKSVGFSGGTKDIGSLLLNMEAFLQEIESSTSQQAQRNIINFQQWLNKIVVSRAFGSAYFNNNLRALGLKGVSLWFPKNREAFDYDLSEYENSALYQDLKRLGDGQNQWQAFLQEYFHPSQLKPLAATKL